MRTDEIARFFPRGNRAWLDALAIIGPDLAVKHGITSVRRWRHFMAQVAAETDGLTIPAMRESLRYRPARVLEVFSYRLRLAQRDNPRFRGRSLEAIAHEIAGDPDLLAETVYGNRPELGNTRPGDGARYIGRGPLQTTGREWYAKLGRAIGVDLVAEPHLLEEPYIGWKAAFAEWEMLGANTLADNGTVEAVSRRVNGGSNGLDRRRAEYHRASVIFAARSDSWSLSGASDAHTASALRSRHDRADADTASRAVALSAPGEEAHVTPRHAEILPQIPTAKSIAAEGSRSMSWLLMLRGSLAATWASVVAFLGVDNIAGTRAAITELKGILNDHAVVIVLLALGLVTAVALLVQHYLVTAARDGRYDPQRPADAEGR